MMVETRRLLVNWKFNNSECMWGLCAEANQIAFLPNNQLVSQRL